MHTSAELTNLLRRLRMKTGRIGGDLPFLPLEVMRMVETFFICGRCGKARKREEVVVVSASRYGVHDGFVAIRCKEHKNAYEAARKAAWRHAQRVKKKMEV